MSDIVPFQIGINLDGVPFYTEFLRMFATLFAHKYRCISDMSLILGESVDEQMN